MAKKVETVNAEFEIIETRLVPATTETKGVQLFKPENKEQVIQAFINAASLSFSVTPEQCKKLVKESSKLTIKGKEDKEGFKKVYEKHREFVKVRTGTEKERKVLTDPFNQIKSGIDTVAKNDILGMTAKEEDRLKSMVDQWKEWEQEEADRIEAEAKKALDERIQALEEVGLKFDGNFYSIGESISVDVVTIKDFTEESFLDFKNRVSSENEKIKLEKHIQELHNERKNELLDLWSFLSEEEKVLNFGEMSEDLFASIKSVANMNKVEFEAEKTRQEEEKVNQANERKALNYEKRSFKLEKEGFEVDEDGTVYFATEFGKTSISKTNLENLNDEEFLPVFKDMLTKKVALEEKAKTVEEDKKKADEEKIETEKLNSRIKAFESIGFKKEIDLLRFDKANVYLGVLKKMEDEAFNKALLDAKDYVKEVLDKEAKEKEAERLQKLPEIEKASNYIDSVLKIEIQGLKDKKIVEIIWDFKNALKVETEKALLKLEKLK